MRASKRAVAPASGAARAGLQGGRYNPLSDADIAQIHEAVLTLLETVGFSEAPSVMIDHVTAAGGHVDAHGRLCFPRTLVAEALAGLRRDFVLCGQDARHDLRLDARRVYLGSGGASPSIIDIDTGKYREATLRDLYDAARLVDTLPNIHFFSRSMTARDMPDARALDINTAYACLAGTTKHVLTSITRPDHVEEVARMCHAIAGSRAAFLERPFLSLNINHVVPPMRFDADSCRVMEAAARLGIPIHANAFGQAGASTPVTIAGSVAQSTAETLAGMIFAWLVNPQARVTFGARPMITDLRTGAMTGGGGEQAVLMAAAIRMAGFYNLPDTCIAGATDSKIADAQSGYEKSLSVTLAAQAGCNMVTQAGGMQASLLGCSFESYVIDNDMLGGIMSSLRAVEVNAETLATDMIGDVVRGEGHFLGSAQTLERMESDFHYPDVADRSTPDTWEAGGSRDIRQIARDRAKTLLATHYPAHIGASTDDALRTDFDIRLPRAAMTATRSTP